MILAGHRDFGTCMLVALVVSAARPGGPAAASRNSTAGYGYGYTAAAETFYGWLRLMNSTAAYGGLRRRLGGLHLGDVLVGNHLFIIFAVLDV